MKNKSKAFLTIGVALVIIAVIFTVVALCNPQLSFPWSNAFTYGLYTGYGVVTLAMFILAIIFKRKDI